jgi:hypothetical protein
MRLIASMFHYLHRKIKVLRFLTVEGNRLGSNATEKDDAGGLPRRGGQAMIEYTVIVAMLVLSLGIFAVFLYTIKEQGGRALDLVALHYP